MYQYCDQHNMNIKKKKVLNFELMMHGSYHNKNKICDESAKHQKITSVNGVKMSMRFCFSN